jgi:hypothetical protein
MATILPSKEEERKEEERKEEKNERKYRGRWWYSFDVIQAYEGRNHWFQCWTLGNHLPFYELGRIFIHY